MFPRTILRTPYFRGAFALALALGLATPAFAQEPLTAQQRCMARRAAELDAYRKLAETVKGFEIKSQTTVKDFVTESDQIQAGFQTFIRGVRIVGDPVFNPDGTCEVQAAVTLSQVIRELKRLHRETYSGDAVSAEDIDSISTRVDLKVITATGYGAPPPPPVAAANPDFTGKSEPAPAEEPDREPGKPRWIYVAAPNAGIAGWDGVTGAGRLMAVRAARMDAIRKLAETIEGIKISSTTTVKDFVTQNDQIKTEVAGFIQGVKSLDEPKYNPDGTVQVTVAVTLAQVVQQVKRIVERHYRGAAYEDIEYKKISTFTKKTVIDATGFGAPDEKMKMPPGSRFIGWEALTGPNARVKLMALQGARTDAQRKFSERTAGLEILSGTYVKDMVAESDVIMTKMRDHLVGAKDVGDIVFYSDGAVEARIGATWSQIIKQVQVEMPAGTDADLLERIRVFEKQHFFFETGSGAVPPTPQFYTGQPLPPNPPAVGPDAPPPWHLRKVRATGYGAPRPGTTGPQAKLLAQRAARMDAYRKLSEEINGIKIRGETTVRDFVTESDVIETATSAFIRGAVEIESKENPDGTCEVTLEVNLADLHAVLQPHMQ